jgi:LytS/YehU family sensor histidine kinase
MFEIFKNEVYIASFRWPVYKFLQHGSTLIGFFIIAMYVFRNRVKGEFELLNRELKCKVIYWLIVLAATASFVYISYITGNIRGIGAVVVVLIDGAVIGCIIASGVDRIKNIM